MCNRNQLKYLVILAMVADHIAYGFLPTDSVWYVVLRFIGRFTAPTMAFFITEGYFHTRNLNCYALRMAVFALVSWLPYSYFLYGTVKYTFSVIYTLLLGLLLVWMLDSEQPTLAKILGGILIGFLSFWGDWLFFIPLWCMGFYLLHQAEHSKRPKQMKAIGIFTCLGTNALYCILSQSLYTLGVFVPFGLLLLYNGKSGSKKPFHKWFFYIFYPAHLMVLAFLRQYSVSLL